MCFRNIESFSGTKQEFDIIDFSVIRQAMIHEEKKSTIFNLSLLPEPDFSRALIAFSEALSGVRAGDYVLGRHSLPHVTVLQFAGQEHEAMSLWDRLKEMRNRIFYIDYLGLALDPWDQSYCLSLRVRKTRELENLQNEALRLFDRRAYFNGLGADYDPHSTLLAWDAGSSIPSFPVDRQLLGRRGVKAHLSLGLSGPRFQFARSLF